MVVISIAGARVGTVGSRLRPSQRLGDEGEDAIVVEAAAVEPKREYVKAKAERSETTTSDRRARACGEIDGLAGSSISDATGGDVRGTWK